MSKLWCWSWLSQFLKQEVNCFEKFLHLSMLYFFVRMVSSRNDYHKSIFTENVIGLVDPLGWRKVYVERVYWYVWGILKSLNIRDRFTSINRAFVAEFVSILSNLNWGIEPWYIWGMARSNYNEPFSAEYSSLMCPFQSIEKVWESWY
jgi:hypothetical protein